MNGSQEFTSNKVRVCITILEKPLEPCYRNMKIKDEAFFPLKRTLLIKFTRKLTDSMDIAPFNNDKLQQGFDTFSIIFDFLYTMQP